jgi:hypothetical protein
MELNEVKKLYKQLIQVQLDKSPTGSGQINIDYTLYPRTRHKQDLDNILSITKKFFQDALVENGNIESDDYETIVHNIDRFGAVDKDYPRVEAVVTWRDLNGGMPF